MHPYRQARTRALVALVMIITGGIGYDVAAESREKDCQAVCSIYGLIHITSFKMYMYRMCMGRCTMVDT